MYTNNYYFFFFFSSRRRHTRWTGDWSSDVCSSDLTVPAPAAFGTRRGLFGLQFRQLALFAFLLALVMIEHADNGKQLAVDVDGLAHRIDFLTDVLRRSKKFIAHSGADHTNVARHFIVDLVEHAAVVDDVLVHLECHGPDAGAIPRTK